MKKIGTILTLALGILMAASAAVAQLSGVYSIGSANVPGEAGHYTYLKEACIALNTSGISGDVTMYFTSDITEPGCAHLGVNTGSHSITFKPYSTLSSCKITFSRATNPAGTAVYGAWVIGNTDTVYQVPVSTNNIVIDGSVAVGGTSRDLTIECTGAATGIYPFRLNGDNNNIAIKNCIITTTGTGTYGVRVTAFRNTAAAVDSVPDNITIENNQITTTTSTTGNPISLDGAATQLTWPTGIAIKNNRIVARHRGIFLNYWGSVDIYGNEIRLSQTTTGYLSYGIQPNALSASAVVNVYNNQFTQISTGNGTSGTYGIIGIYAGIAGTWNVYNNTLAGFATTTATTDPSIARVWGIQVATVTATLYNNTIYMPNLAYAVSTNGTSQTYNGIYLSSGTVTAKDNIIVSAETSDTSCGLYNAGATLTSDYNNFYVPGSGTNGFVGYSSGTRYATLANWQASTGTPDLNSKSVAVTFAGTTDLHLNNSYKTTADFNLAGTPIGTVTTDIDGQTRSSSFPYMGADEIVEQPLPVELTSFSASTHGKSVELTWATATETNNAGFSVERKAIGADWQTVTFIKGQGTSNKPASYSYTDNVAAGRYTYRLKQVDQNGAFKYTSSVEAIVESAPAAFGLMQNYPNPFNPTTMIRFSVATPQKVTLKIYNTAGQEVTTLFEGTANAGAMYEVPFNASSLASGMYFSVLQTATSREVKKMTLLR